MKVNTKIRYGLRMVVTLAQSEKVINTVELGEIMLVSPKYLRKLAGPLEHASIIRSVQGIYGGYTLNKKAKDITIAMIFKAYDEKLDISNCVTNNDCVLSEKCLTRPVWQYMENVLRRELLNITIDDVLTEKVPKVIN